jgi:hypothetical protein
MKRFPYQTRKFASAEKMSSGLSDHAVAVQEEPVAQGVPVAAPVAANWTDAVVNRKRVIRKRKDSALDLIAEKKQKIEELQADLFYCRHLYLALTKEDWYLDAMLDPTGTTFLNIVDEEGADPNQPLDDEDDDEV